MNKKNTIKVFCISLVLFPFIAFLIQSCKKTEKMLYANKPINEASIARFLEQSGSDTLILTVQKDLRTQLFDFDFSGDFRAWHGQPLWDKAIKIIRDSLNFTYIVPTQKGNEIATFFIVNRRKGKYYYEMHRRSSLHKGIAEHTATRFDKTLSQQLLNYFDYTILNKTDTLLSPYKTPKSGNGSGIQPSAGKMVTLCWLIWEQVPCGDEKNARPPASNQHVVYCYNQFQHCITFDDGGGGSGGGDDGSDDGGGGGGGGENPDPCPFAPWYSEGFVPVGPSCGGGGGNGPDGDTTVIPNPCAQADSLAHDLALIHYMDTLKTRANNAADTAEHGYVYLNGVNGSLALSPIDGDPGIPGIDFEPYVKIDGYLHDHYTGLLSVFSADDVISICKIYQTNKMMNMRTFTGFVTTASNTQYILKISDTAKFKSFVSSLLISGYNDFRMVYGFRWGIRPTNTNAVNERAFLRFLKRTNGGAGLKMFRGNSTFTQWTPLGLDEDDNVIEQPCN